MTDAENFDADMPYYYRGRRVRWLESRRLPAAWSVERPSNFHIALGSMAALGISTWFYYRLHFEGEAASVWVNGWWELLGLVSLACGAAGWVWLVIRGFRDFRKMLIPWAVVIVAGAFVVVLIELIQMGDRPGYLNVAGTFLATVILSLVFAERKGETDEPRT